MTPIWRSSSRSRATGGRIEPLLPPTTTRVWPRRWWRASRTRRPTAWTRLSPMCGRCSAASSATLGPGAARSVSGGVSWLLRPHPRAARSAGAAQLPDRHLSGRRAQRVSPGQDASVDVAHVDRRAPRRFRSARQTRKRGAVVARLYRLILAVSADDRALFVTRYVDELEVGEIAAATGRSLSTTKRHLARATRRVVARMRRDPAPRGLRRRSRRGRRRRRGSGRAGSPRDYAFGRCARSAAMAPA